MQLHCDDVQRLIPWLLDDELDPEQALEVENHLEGCDPCRVTLDQEGRLRVAVRRAGRSVYAPTSLRRRVHAAIEREQRYRRAGGIARSWPGALAALVLMAMMWGGMGTGNGRELEEITRRHTGGLPMDFVAADLGAVQSYLRSKLPFAVRLPKARAEGVRPLGGRVIRLGDRDTAYVRLDTDGGPVSVFVYEDRDAARTSEGAPGLRLGGRRIVMHRVRGYTAARWRDAGLVYSVVSDMPERELGSTLDHWLSR